MHLKKTELAKKIAKVIRHEPEKLDIQLDDEGWVQVHALQDGFARLTPYEVSFEDIVHAVTDTNRGRFEYDEDAECVRALKGHTTSQVSYKVAEPPDDGVYLAISMRHMTAIEEHGILPVRRRYTQVFPAFMDAVKDGKRRRIKHMCIVLIKSHQAYHDGTLFYEHDDQWYIEEVDPAHIDVLDYDDPDLE